LEDRADQDGEVVALRHGAERFTYRELDGMANAMAHELAASDVGPGSRVAIMTSNRPEFAFTLFAVLKLGAAAVMVNPSWKTLEIEHALGLTEPTIAICDGDAALPEAVAASTPSLHLDRDAVRDRLMGGSGQRLGISLEWERHDAVLVFSSGTTGMPKAVRHSHATLGAATLHWSSALGLGRTDSLQIATPPFHILGLLNILACINAGASVRLHPRFDLDAVLRCVEEDRITVEMAVAPIALAMADHPALESFDLSSLRFIMWGATPVTQSVAEHVTRRTGVRFLPAYGTSEVPVITSNPVTRPDRWRLDSPGLAVHDVHIRIVDPETSAVLPPGVPGEIQVRSPSTMVGYLPDDANEDAFLDGWYRTGDVGWLEDDGWLHITDRLKEMIKVKGFQVAPAEVESVLLSHPAVVDCAVFGVPDPRAGEAVAAAVQLKPTLEVTDDELTAYVADRLSSYKRITHLDRVAEIPRLPSGKALRRVLRERHARTDDT
jgi:acyl-CoA synthetase (AMP-forming)/AMP-acid ligase II